MVKLTPESIALINYQVCYFFCPPYKVLASHDDFEFGFSLCIFLTVTEICFLKSGASWVEMHNLVA